MDTLRYAAYGSNLHPLRLRERAPSARLEGTGFLPDWSLRFHKRSVDASAKCSIQQGSSGVHFAIYDVSKADKENLDRIEGVGSGYDVMHLDIPDFGQCFSYAASDTHIDETLDPYDWYQALVLAGARALGFPRDYVEGIAAVSTRADPDPVRRREMWGLVDSIEVQGFDLAGQGVSAPSE